MLTINNTLDGYLKDVEIKGNTVQDPDNLADIRSVGDKVEGQELYEIPVLSCGKNLINVNDIVVNEGVSTNTGNFGVDTTRSRTSYIKFNPNVNYVATNVEAVFFYDKNKQFISVDRALKGVSPSNCNYIVIRMLNTTTNWQFEEGTQATPYEPHQEDKLTILSPTPLEKVGDIRDRIIEKNGVWGVEKSIKTVVFDGTVVSGNVSSNFPSDNSSMFYIVFTDTANDSVLICDKFPNKNISHISNRNIEGVFVSVNGSNNAFYFRIFNDKLPTQDVQGFKQWLSENNVTIKYKTVNPSFIPLPHDQQVKLRTFANKTNISFLTEIEGTIKAQVPKSIGATVNTHTEQISNLNKELDRVKKLEESTVSTVTTESDFTTVEATSNGYFEDVKLEGKTLVNLNNFKKSSSLSDRVRWENNDVKNIQGGVTVWNLSDKPISIDVHHLDTDTYKAWYNVSSNSCKVISIGDNEKVGAVIGLFVNGWTSSELDKLKKSVIILEGDHAQNPPSYFEGLKSVGDGADEIVVSSVNENLLDGDLLVYGMFNYSNGDVEVSTTTKHIAYPKLIKIEPNTTYYSYGNLKVVTFLDANKKYINWTNVSNKVTTPSNCCYVKIRTLNELDGQLEEYKNNSYFSKQDKYTPHQSDKKRLLYYNTETQAWEKPILREGDSIEKHADGKYYYHQRSGEVVLNGSENWNNDTNSSTMSPATYRQSIQFDAIDIPSASFNTKTLPNIISDLLPTVIFGDVYSHNHIGISISGTDSVGTHIIINNNFTDVTELKQWLQANNLTVVYQLAQEKVYECTNIDLITYANETNFIVESGVLSPKTTLKVHSNISNVVSLLQKKVSLLESNMTKYMITQNRLQLSSTYSADSVTFKVDYTVCSENMSQENYDTDLYNLILNNILVGKDNYNYDHMFNIIMDYASWSQISWDQFDILVGLMDIQHNPPIEEIPTDDEIVEEMPNEIM